MFMIRTDSELLLQALKVVLLIEFLKTTSFLLLPNIFHFSFISFQKE